MAKLYIMGTAEELQEIRLALDWANGYFDMQGNRIPPGDGTTIGPPTLTQDATVGFMWLPQDPDFVIPWLGQVHNGTLIPASGDLLLRADLPQEFQDYLIAWDNFFGPKPAFPDKPDPWPPEPPADDPGDPPECPPAPAPAAARRTLASRFRRK
jgi:hypothetical protein